MEFDKQLLINDVEVRCAQFHKQNAREVHLILTPSKRTSLDEQLKNLKQAYTQALSIYNLEPQQALWGRFYSSDLVNHFPMVKKELHAILPASICYLEQPPLPDKKAALWIYLVDAHSVPSNTNGQPSQTRLDMGPCTHIWQSGWQDATTESSYNQTHGIFKQFNNSLTHEHLTLKDHVIRTWLFVQNVDANYNGVVVARRELFEKEDLTPQSHYIASTGIEGRSPYPEVKVTMDTYSIKGILPQQIKYLQAPTHLNPTHEYGVTFERATSVDYGDRRHIFISGTASINNKGEVVHLLNIEKQTKRTFENIEALLHSASASFSDMAQMIVYLRDFSDYETVKAYLEKHYPQIPYLIVHGPVCRPGWLIEVEGIAIKDIDSSFAPF